MAPNSRKTEPAAAVARASPAAAPAVLVTGFGAFAGRRWNPSSRAATGAARALRPRVRACVRRLPVVWGSATFGATWFRSCPADSPALLLHFGLAESRKRVELERGALAAPSLRLDESGAPPAPDLFCGESGRVETRFRVHDLLGRLRLLVAAAPNGDVASPLPEVAESDDAGDYLCNALYWHSLRAAAVRSSRGAASAALFVHLPLVRAEEAERIGAIVAVALLDAFAELRARAGG